MHTHAFAANPKMSAQARSCSSHADSVFQLVCFESVGLAESETVVTLLLVATDVDLLEASQSLLCPGFANCVGSVRDVARPCILSRKHQLEQKVRAGMV